MATTADKQQSGNPIPQGKCDPGSDSYFAALAAREIELIQLARVNRTIFKAYVLTDDMGLGLDPAALHLSWDQHIDYCALKNYYAGIMAPWGHGKTEWCVIGDALFDLARNPQIRMKIVCNTDTNASLRIMAIRKVIEENDKFKIVFPGIEQDPTQKWNAHALFIKRKGASKDPSVEGCGIMSSGIGGRADTIRFDDPVDFKNSVAEPKKREMVKDSVKQTWLSRLDVKAGPPQNYCPVIWIATPWHTEDATYSYVMKNEKFCVLFQSVAEPGMNQYECFRNGRESTKWTLPLWGEKFPNVVLKDKRKALGERSYARGFRLKPFSSDDIILKSFAACLDYGLTPQEAMAETGDDFRIISAVDPSGSRRAGFAIFTLAVGRRTGKRIPIDIRVGSWKGREAINQCLAVQNEFGPDVFLVENNAIQERVREWLQDAGGNINTKPCFTGTNKADPEAGVPGMDIEFSNKLWIVALKQVDHRGADDCACAWCRWLNEVMYYPLYGSTDVLMASWFAREEARGGKSLAEILRAIEAGRGIVESVGGGKRKGPSMEAEFKPHVLSVRHARGREFSDW